MFSASLGDRRHERYNILYIGTYYVRVRTTVSLASRWLVWVFDTLSGGSVFPKRLTRKRLFYFQAQTVLGNALSF